MTFHSALPRWLPLAFVMTILCGLVYVGCHTVLRQGANEIPLHVADLAEQALRAGRPPTAIVAPGSVDMKTNSNVFLIIFDASRKVVASTAMVSGRSPEPPSGVLTESKRVGEDRITWEPEPGARAAIVARYVNAKPDWYVVAGQSLTETERIASKIAWATFLAWVVALAGSFGIMKFWIE